MLLDHAPSVVVAHGLHIVFFFIDAAVVSQGIHHKPIQAVNLKISKLDCLDCFLFPSAMPALLSAHLYSKFGSGVCCIVRCRFPIKLCVELPSVHSTCLDASLLMRGFSSSGNVAHKPAFVH